MHAIIETGGKQYKVAEGDTLYIEKLNVEAGETVTFDKVLAVLDGDTARFGAPAVDGASVTANVVKNGKGKKVLVFKYKPKKNYRRRQGHRRGLENKAGNFHELSLLVMDGFSVHDFKGNYNGYFETKAAGRKKAAPRETGTLLSSINKTSCCGSCGPPRSSCGA